MRGYLAKLPSTVELARLQTAVVLEFCGIFLRSSMVESLVGSLAKDVVAATVARLIYGAAFA